MKNKKIKKILSIFLSFLKISAFTFGGGYAMFAIMQNEFVEKKGWLTKDEFLDMVAIAESTPGPLAINSATYIGYRQSGVLGSVLATIGVCIPPFAIIYIISLFLDKFMSLKFVGYAFKGIQACAIYLILSAAIKMAKGLKKTPINIIIFSAVTCAIISFSLFSIKFSSIIYILICACIGLVVYIVSQIKRRFNKRGGEK